MRGANLPPPGIEKILIKTIDTHSTSARICTRSLSKSLPYSGTIPLFKHMKKTTHIALALGLALTAPLSLQANGGPPADLTQETFTGRVNLSRPALVEGQRISRLNFSGRIQAQGSEGVNVNPADETIASITGALARPQRVTNRSILEVVLDGAPIRGWSLQWNAYAVGATALVMAVNRDPNIAPIAVPAEIFSLDASWAAEFDGLFRGTASFTVSETASGTVAFVEQGRFTGFNTFLGNLKLGNPAAIIFSGAGTFRDDTRGFLGKANVAGDNYTPAPSL